MIDKLIGHVDRASTPRRAPKRIKNQPTYKDYGLPDKLHAAPEPKGKPPEVEGEQARMREITKATGMKKRQKSSRAKTPAGDVILDQRFIEHIATRSGGRYRFAHLIRPTLEQPDEVWNTLYDNGEVRRTYVKQFVGKGSAVVVERRGNRAITAIAASKTKDVNLLRRGHPAYIQGRKK